ncbi:hypothetical protein [Vibrio hepatarius]|uniref:hypothetical protein n=1 Tax=Vibrio hepatarius TaxID=171383 RepID=UPI00142E742F|nr:hypothetical protein [Vibrio hepatarius]NIY81945.1 hypothetical protein [Vibrio hepatarius]
MNKDNTLAILDEIDFHIEGLENGLDFDNDFLDEIDDSLVSLLSSMIDDSGAVGLKQSSFENLNVQISQRINDFEIAITEARASEVFANSNLNPISFEGDGVSVLITPKNKPRIILPRQINQYSYSVEMLVDMAVLISNQNESLMTMSLRIRFSLDDDGRITPIIILSPRFIKENAPHNPYTKIPVKHQANVLQTVKTEILQALINNSVKFEPLRFGDIRLGGKPSTFILSRGYLLFVSKALPKRKLPEPLISYINRGYTQAAKVKDKIIEKEIRRHVAGRASLNSISFKNGFIRISTNRSDSRDILHIAVKTWVRMDYRIYFTVSNLTELSLDARWAEWDYRIKAKRCWPVCDEVISAAGLIVKKEINRNKYFTEYVGSFGATASRIRTRITPYGLQLDMRTR